jgi:hypothetical protein
MLTSYVWGNRGGRGVGERARAASGSPAGWMALTLVIATMGAAAGCGSQASVTPVQDAGPQVTDAGPVGMIVTGPPQPCTEPHTICVNAMFPASMTAQPNTLQIDLYVIVPPMDPPDGVPIMIPTPAIQPGETVQLRMSDLGLTGNYHFLGLVFMPGGGFQLPVAGVDYIGDSSVAYPFTGQAMNLPETLAFHMYQ